MFWTFDDGINNPFTALHDLQKEVNRIFNSYENTSNRFPSVNIRSNSDELVVTAELPGIDPDEINVTVVQGQLTISGERKVMTPSEKEKCHRQERFQGHFSRSFRLPFDVDSEKVTANYENGILKVILPHLEEAKPKKIEIAVK